jgi:hypothetical protein
MHSAKSIIFSTLKSLVKQGLVVQSIIRESCYESYCEHYGKDPHDDIQEMESLGVSVVDK